MIKEIISIETNEIQVGDKFICIPNVRPLKILSQGANGVAIVGQHLYLDRKVVIKIWQHLRKSDNRDKINQGIRESRKAAQFTSERAAKIYDTGVINDCVYSVMEYVEGIILKDWLNRYCPNLFSRIVVAQKITNAVFEACFQGIIHGDAHSKNIMILSPYEALLPFRIVNPGCKLIDFGTSYFSGQEASEKRHWRIFTSTYTEILNPFDIKRFNWLLPDYHNYNALYARYINFIDIIIEMLYSFEFSPNAISDDSTQWAKLPNSSSTFFKHPDFGPELLRLYTKGKLILTPEKIGILETGSYALKYLEIKTLL